VCTTACPMTDSGGQLAGFVSNALAVHAFCSVVKREGSCLGSSTLTDLTLASVPIEPGGVGQLHGQAGTIGFARGGGGRDHEHRFERQDREVRDLEASPRPFLDSCSCPCF